MKPARRRTVSRAQVERAFRDLQKRWRPPDSRRDNARRRPGVGEALETGLNKQAKYNTGQRGAR